MIHILHVDSSPRNERLLRICYETLNCQAPYLRTILGRIGITDITVPVENDKSDSTGLIKSIANAQTQIAQLVKG